MCWLTAYLVEQWDAAADKAGVEAYPVGSAREATLDVGYQSAQPIAAFDADALRKFLANPGPVTFYGFAAMDVPPAEPAQVFNYEKQVWETPGAVEPPKPEPCAIIPAADEYSTIAARLREIEAEKQAALERANA